MRSVSSATGTNHIRDLPLESWDSQPDPLLGGGILIGTTQSEPSLSISERRELDVVVEEYYAIEQRRRSESLALADSVRQLIHVKVRASDLADRLDCRK